MLNALVENTNRRFISRVAVTENQDVDSAYQKLSVFKLLQVHYCNNLGETLKHHKRLRQIPGR